jgi:Protein of unknown function (DUF3106)
MTIREVWIFVSPQRFHFELGGCVAGGQGARSLSLSCLMMAGLMALSTTGFAQTDKAPVAAGTALTGKAAAPGPAWSELMPSQQKALAPLASSWNTTMSEAQKRKWLEISKNYSALAPEGQAMLNSRMNEWVSLSPQQRARARLNFGKTKELSKQLTPEEKKAQWEAYQALSPEEKQKLAAKGSPRPAGAATAIKPVAPQKLATVPAHPAGMAGIKPAPKITPSPPAAVSVPVPPSVAQPAPVGN